MKIVNNINRARQPATGKALKKNGCFLGKKKKINCRITKQELPADCDPTPKHENNLKI
jgi:hypothetical protein